MFATEMLLQMAGEVLMKIYQVSADTARWRLRFRCKSWIRELDTTGLSEKILLTFCMEVFFIYRWQSCWFLLSLGIGFRVLARVGGLFLVDCLTLRFLSSLNWVSLIFSLLRSIVFLDFLRLVAGVLWGLVTRMSPNSANDAFFLLCGFHLLNRLYN